MAHHDLMDQNRLPEADAALISARFHLRGGRRYLQKGLSAAGIAALYEAVFCGMHYYLLKHQDYSSFVENTDPWDASKLFQALTQSNVFDDPLTFNRFSLIVERALWHGPSPFDVNAVITESEKMLTKLEVIPMKKSVPTSETRVVL